MKSKGINSEKDLMDFRSLEENKLCGQVMYEVLMKNMITSCFTYGGAEKESYNFEKYIQKYKDNLTEEIFEAVYEEQMEYLKTFKIVSGVYTDSEGCTYNSLQKI